MNKTVVKIVIGVVAAGVTGVGGYFGYRWYKRRKQDKADNAPLEVEHISYKTEWAKPEQEQKTVVRDEDDSTHKQTDIRKDKFARQVSAYVQTEGEKENFEAYLSSMESPEDDEADEDSDGEYDEDDLDIPGHSMDNPAIDGPYEITAGEFCNNRTYYDKISVNYFAEDEVVADDRDEVMENASRILGDLQAAFSGPRAPSVVYIRNEALEVDYEVSFVDGSYRKEVLHLEKEE